MQKLKNTYIKYVIYAGLVLLVIAGLSTYLRSPAPKPLPPQTVPEEKIPAVPPPPQQPQPIPGVGIFDVNKYKQEPVVIVWFADKGTRQSMPLEKYLEGVIAREMEPDWPLEALAAQAIASRTLTINAIEAGTIKKLHQADVSTAKEELQAYDSQRVNDNVRQAVSMTRGKIILYGGSIVNAIYSACCAQTTATKEESFPKQITTPTPYFQPVNDNCLKNAPPNQQKWTVKISGSEVAQAVGYNGNPADIRILEKGPSGRILFIGAGKEKIYGAELRQKLGFDRLMSTKITELRYENGSFIFEGTGWGNGVGMCQWGAYTFAREGKKHEEILKHYYSGIEIKKLYD